MITKRKVVVYIFALILILFNYTSSGIFLGKISKEVVLFVPLSIGLLLLFMLFIKRTVINIQSAIIFFVLCVNIFLSSLFSGNLVADVYILIGGIFVAFVVSNSISKKDFVNCYVNLVCILAVYSIMATYVFLPLHMHGMLNIFPIFKIDNRSFLDMYFAMGMRTFSIPRNTGFCREPGVYQIFLLTAIYFAIERQPKSNKNIIINIILIITLFTTFSAVAYITTIVSLFMFLKKYINKNVEFFKVVVVILTIIILLAIFVNTNDAVKFELERTISKWNINSDQSGSFKVRLSGVIANIELFLEKPLLGYGLTTSWIEIIERYGYVDVTGTTFIGFAAFGIIFGSIIHYMLWKMCYTANLISSIIWFLAIFIALLSQNLIITNLFWIILFYTFMKDEKILPDEDSLIKQNYKL